MDASSLLEHVHRLSLSARYAVVPRKPRAMAQIAYDVAEVARGKRPLRYVDLALDYRCNLSCEHCSAESLKRPGERLMDASEWRRVVDQGLAMGGFLFGLTGGEPLVRNDLEDLIAALGPERFITYVVTNGTLLTARRAKSLYEAGVDIVGVSLDSADAQDHDTMRACKGAQTSAWEAIRNALGAGLKVVVASTVTKQSVRSPGLDQLLTQTGQMRLMTVLGMACPVGSWAGREDVLLGLDEMRLLSELMERHKHTRRDFQSNWVETGCGAAKEKLYVSAYGEVMPCPFMQVSFGNVRTQSLASIRRRMVRRKELEGYSPRCMVAEDPGFVERLGAAVSSSSSS